jgi:hypothetical protein
MRKGKGTRTRSNSRVTASGNDYLYSLYGRVNHSPWFPNMVHLSVVGQRINYSSFEAHWGRLSAIYFLCANQGVSYIGKSTNVFYRDQRHHHHPHGYIYIFPIPTRLLDSWEKAAIRELQPPFNRRGRNLRRPQKNHIDDMSDFIYRRRYLRVRDAAPVFRIDLVDWSSLRDNTAEFHYPIRRS